MAPARNTAAIVALAVFSAAAGAEVCFDTTLVQTRMRIMPGSANSSSLPRQRREQGFCMVPGGEYRQCGSHSDPGAVLRTTAAACAEAQAAAGHQSFIWKAAEGGYCYPNSYKYEVNGLDCTGEDNGGGWRSSSGREYNTYESYGYEGGPSFSQTSCSTPEACQDDNMGAKFAAKAIGYEIGGSSFRPETTCADNQNWCTAPPSADMGDIMRKYCCGTCGPITTTAPPTAAPTTTASAGSGNANPTASGDPHMHNVAGARFDVKRPGVFPFLVLPKASTQPLLRVMGSVERFGVACDALYIRKLRIDGAWLRDVSRIALFAGSVFQVGASRNLTVEEFAGLVPASMSHVTRSDKPRELAKANTHDTPVEVTLKLGPTSLQVSFVTEAQPGGGSVDSLWLKAHLSEAGGAIGGILGDDSHELAASPDNCLKAPSEKSQP